MALINITVAFDFSKPKNLFHWKNNNNKKYKNKHKSKQDDQGSFEIGEQKRIEFWFR